MYRKPTDNIILKSELLNVFHQNIETRQACLLSLRLSLNTIQEDGIGAIMQEKTKGIHIGKEEQLFLLTDDIIAYGQTETLGGNNTRANN